MVKDQLITPRYALYNGDAMEVLPTLRDASVGLSIYSPPFGQDSGGGLYHYSSSERDLSNARTYKEFMEHYEFFVREIARVTMPGRMSVVHCMDVPSGNTGCDYYSDFPGDIIRLHQKCGFKMASPRITIWKEPLAVRNRTLTKALAHRSIVEDSCDCAIAGADYLLIFRRDGVNAKPVTHDHGLTRYYGERAIPADLIRYRGWTGKQTENRYSHWIWRQYASSVWDDIRGNTGNRKVSGVLTYKEARDPEDEKHVHPLQLDVIGRAVTLWSNPDDIVLTTFMGVGSEVYGAVRAGRRGIGVELKPSYYRQAVKNLASVEIDKEDDQFAFDWAQGAPGDDEEGWLPLEVQAQAPPDRPDDFTGDFGPNGDATTPGFFKSAEELKKEAQAPSDVDSIEPAVDIMAALKSSLEALGAQAPVTALDSPLPEKKKRGRKKAQAPPDPNQKTWFEEIAPRIVFEKNDPGSLATDDVPDWVK